MFKQRAMDRNADQLKQPAWVDGILATKPVPARAFTLGEDDRVSISVPRFDGYVLKRILVPLLKKPDFSIRLDPFGSFVWKHCDGSKTGEEIAQLLADQWPEETEMRLRLAMFLRLLLGQGHLADSRAPQK